jgi:hypothetical protein
MFFSYEPSTLLRILCSHIRFLECLSLSRSYLENAIMKRMIENVLTVSIPYTSQSCVSSTSHQPTQLMHNKLRYSYLMFSHGATFLSDPSLESPYLMTQDTISHDSEKLLADLLYYTNKYPAILLFFAISLLQIVSS